MTVGASLPAVRGDSRHGWAPLGPAGGLRGRRYARAGRRMLATMLAAAAGGGISAGESAARAACAAGEGGARCSLACSTTMGKRMSKSPMESVRKIRHFIWICEKLAGGGGVALRAVRPCDDGETRGDRYQSKGIMKSWAWGSIESVVHVQRLTRRPCR